MTTMISEIYDALRSANADEALARRAAEALATHDQRFGGLEREISDMRAAIGAQIGGLRTDMERQFGGIERQFGGVERQFGGIAAELGALKGDIRLLKWQIGLIGAVMVAIGLPSLWLLVRLAAKAGALPG